MVKISEAATAGAAVDMSELLISFMNDIVYVPRCVGEVLPKRRPEQAIPGACSRYLGAARWFQHRGLLPNLSPNHRAQEGGLRKGRETEEEMGRTAGQGDR